MKGINHLARQPSDIVSREHEKHSRTLSKVNPPDSFLFHDSKEEYRLEEASDSMSTRRASSSLSERVVMRENSIWNHVWFIVDDDICESSSFDN